MEIFIYIISSMVALFGFGLFVNFRSTGAIGSLIYSLILWSSCLVASTLVTWWPFLLAFVIGWGFRLLGLDPEAPKTYNNYNKANKLFLDKPKTYEALQILIPSMADANNTLIQTADKKLFHKTSQYMEFEKNLLGLPIPMLLDKIIDGTETDEELINLMEEQIKTFQSVFPNWLDAYTFGYDFISDNHHLISSFHVEIKTLARRLT